LPPQNLPNVCSWSKSYCEPRRDDVLDVVPSGAKQVLSIGCGTGATEAALVGRGCRVVGVPLDAIVGETARTGGVEVTPPNFQKAFELLDRQRFDGIIFIDLLSYVDDPSALVAKSVPLLADRGTLVVAAPNWSFLGYRKKQTLGRRVGCAPDAIPAPYVHHTTPRMVREWLRQSGLRVERLRYHENPRFHWLMRVCPGIAGPYLSRSFVATAGKRSVDQQR
jgi:2-polyprenyl-3-methyl-5-hydroxy-6-metoxy-1,4-benzoquinol methylase